MSRLIKNFLFATAGAVLASGCVTAPGHPGPAGHPAEGAMMTRDQQCMMSAQHAKAGEQPGMPMQGKTDAKCPMMQTQSASDTPSAPSLAPPESHPQTPDAPPAGH